jgi:hypothetical protein
VLGLQLIQPDAPVPSLPGDGPISDYVLVPGRVDSLLREACYDCHSHEIRWPWYARVSPLSWWIVGDVEHGLSNLDFSRWSTDPVIEPTPVQRLTWICRDIREAIMPPRSYLRVHRAARLTEEDQALICEWTRSARQALPAGDS